MVTTEVEVGEVVEASIIVAAVVDTAVVEEATSRTEAIKTGEVSKSIIYLSWFSPTRTEIGRAHV